MQRFVQKEVHRVQWWSAVRALGGTMLAQVTVATVQISVWTASCWVTGKVFSHLPVGSGNGNG